MGTHQVRWMALDHKYGSWFDYMEPHVKPTTLAQPFSTTYTISFPPPSPSGRMSHISANVAAFYLPLVTATLLYPNRGEPRIEIPPLLFFYFSRTRQVTNEATGRDASTRVHLNLKIEHGKIEVLHHSFHENHYGNWRVLYSCIFKISFRSLHGY